ncbi:hypothetical protein HYV84_04060 [Candidatus Woesearchaeota archaeon]|nr:hypothetical protein [Candidatus Woesearchaeota archaeon]
MSDKMKMKAKSLFTKAKVFLFISLLLSISLPFLVYSQLSEDFNLPEEPDGWGMSAVEGWLGGENSLGEVFPSLDAWYADDNLFARGVCTMGDEEE